MSPKQARTLTATAYHEAGHAVAQWRQYMRFKHVTIKPEGDSLGHVLSRQPRWLDPEGEVTGRKRLRVEREIIADFAGQLSEGKFRGRRPRFGMHSDNQAAVDLAFRFIRGSRDTVEAYLRYCFLSARDLVDANWRAVEVVAKALSERETMRFEDVVEVIMPGSGALRKRLDKKLLAAKAVGKEGSDGHQS